MESNTLDDKYQQTLLGHFLFEAVSLFGRLFFNLKPRNKFYYKYLNLGCGYTYFKGWTNADFFHFPIRFWRKQKPIPDWMLDIRYPINCKDNYWDGIFTEHTIEHITHKAAFNLFKEFYRTLRPGGVLRIIVPDIETAIRFYNNETLSLYYNEKFEGAEAIWEVTQNYQHKSVWDAALLTKFLYAAGFTTVYKTSFGIGSNRHLCIDQSDRKEYSLYVEAIKW